MSSVTGFEADLTPDSPSQQIAKEIVPVSLEGKREVRISEMCLARSGDKGDMTNIGLIARNEVVYEFIKKTLTAQFVKSQFTDLCKGEVIRYELDNLLALNFLLEQSLDGGGTRSLMIDAQGKTFAAALLNQKIPVPDEVYDTICPL